MVLKLMLALWLMLWLVLMLALLACKRCKCILVRGVRPFAPAFFRRLAPERTGRNAVGFDHSGIKPAALHRIEVKNRNFVQRRHRNETGPEAQKL